MTKSKCVRDVLTKASELESGQPMIRKEMPIK